MNNQWRDNANLMVVWADSTYDSKRSCDECGLLNCKLPIHADRYKEIGEDPLKAADEHVMGYWSWMAVNKPLGSKQDFDGEWMHTEFLSANPDGLAEGVERSSGISEALHGIARRAFEQLSDRQKQVWDLIMRQQLSELQAAEKLGVSRNSVKTHLARARLSFTNYLRSKQ